MLGDGLRNFSMLHYEVEEAWSKDVVDDKIDFVQVFVGLIYLHHVWMIRLQHKLVRELNLPQRFRFQLCFTEDHDGLKFPVAQ